MRGLTSAAFQTAIRWCAILKFVMSVLQTFFLFVLGLCVGSFLNVLIDRLPKEEQVFRGRSYCDHCHHQLAWYDLIPVLSWLCLRGRCRYCYSPISWQYPVVEIITGLSFVFIYQWVMSWCSASLDCCVATLLHGYIASSLIVIFFTDLKYQIIPDKVVFSGIGLALLFHLFHRPRSPFAYASGHLGGVLPAGLGAAGFFLCLFLLTRGKGMGMGDVKLALFMGLFLGFPKIVIAFYLAFLTGALLGVILILLKKKKFGEHIPFGPFLVGGTLGAMFWGEKILRLWLKIIQGS